MAINKAKKKEIVSKIEGEITQSPAVVFVNFHGLSVALITALRKLLRSEGVGLMVAKKTLIKRAFSNQAVTGELPALDGEVAMAYLTNTEASEDQTIAPARTLYQFQKANKDSLKLLGGIFGGAYIDAGRVVSIAAIPAREVLYGQLVGMLSYPMRGLVVALDQVSKKLPETNQ